MPAAFEENGVSLKGGVYRATSFLPVCSLVVWRRGRCPAGF